MRTRHYRRRRRYRRLRCVYFHANTSGHKSKWRPHDVDVWILREFTHGENRTQTMTKKRNVFSVTHVDCYKPQDTKETTATETTTTTVQENDKLSFTTLFTYYVRCEAIYKLTKQTDADEATNINYKYTIFVVAVDLAIGFTL